MSASSRWINWKVFHVIRERQQAERSPKDDLYISNLHLWKFSSRRQFATIVSVRMQTPSR